jgi:heme oxygenase (biliverdin-IX-beta and delta-forming)
MQNTDRRTALREATAAAHRQLDAIASTFDVATYDGYACFLVANAAPLSALELALENGGIAEWMTDWPQRTRRNEIARDLRSLQRPSLSVSVAPIETRSEQLGVLYVLEGSRLGTQVIAKQVEQSADARVLAARQFLRASGVDQWRSFIRDLESADGVSMERAIDAALQAFALYRNSFEVTASSEARCASA